MRHLDLAEIAMIGLIPIPSTAGISDVHIGWQPPGKTDKRLTGLFDYSNLDSLAGHRVRISRYSSSFSGILERRDYGVCPPFYSMYISLPENAGDALTVFRPHEVESVSFGLGSISIWLKDSRGRIETEQSAREWFLEPIKRTVLGIITRIRNKT